MKRLLFTTATVLSMTLSSAFADYEQHYLNENEYAWAEVVSVNPVIERVRVSDPEQRCWDEVVHSPTYYRSGSSAGATIAGGLFGGLIGNRLARRNARPFATFAGVLAGAAIGHELSSRREYGYQEVSHVQRCEEVDRYRTEERVDGYDVGYKYQGKYFHTHLPYRPEGNMIRVRVSVVPMAE